MDVVIRHDYGSSVWYEASNNWWNSKLEEYEYISGRSREYIIIVVGIVVVIGPILGLVEIVKVDGLMAGRLFLLIHSTSN